MIDATNNDDNNGTHKLLSLITKFQEAYSRLRHTTIPQLPLEIAIIESTIDAPASEIVNETAVKSVEKMPATPAQQDFKWP